MYLHSQGMIHGDLKGVRHWMMELMSHLTQFVHKGQHTDR